MPSARHSKIAPSGALRNPRGIAASKCGSGSGAATMTKWPSGAISMTRSCQPSASLTAWCTGSASMNSLATMMHGPGGTSSIALCHRIGGVEPFEHALLHLLQRRTDLDQMHDQRVAKAGDDFRRPQRVVHQGAASGAELDDADIFRRAHLLPDRAHPQPDQLAEHLADLGRGDEIAAGAERIAIDVIAVLRMRQAQPHIFGNRHRSGDADQPADFVIERRARLSHFSRRLS